MALSPRWFWLSGVAVIAASLPAAGIDPPFANTLSFSDVSAVLTQSRVSVAVSVGTSRPLAQLSFGLDYDDDMLRFAGASPAPHDSAGGTFAHAIQAELRDGTLWVTVTFLDRVPPSIDRHVLDLQFDLPEYIPMTSGWPTAIAKVGALDGAGEKPLFLLEEPNLSRTFVQPIVSPGEITIFTADAIELVGATATPDTDTVSVAVLLTHLFPGSVLRMGLDYDDDLLEVRDVRPGPALDGMPGLWIDWIAKGGRLDVEVDLGRNQLPAGSHQKILEIRIAVEKGRFEPSTRIPIRVVTGAPATSFQLGAIVHGKGTAIELLPRAFVRGDVDGNGIVDIADAILLLRSLFEDDAIACRKAGDADDSGALTVGDVVRILGHVYGGAPAPPPPFPAPGQDPTPDPLPCP